MAGITIWNFYFRLFAGSIKGPQLIEFLQHLRRHIGLVNKGHKCIESVQGLRLGSSERAWIARIVLVQNQPREENHFPERREALEPSNSEDGVRPSLRDLRDF